MVWPSNTVLSKVDSHAANSSHRGSNINAFGAKEQRRFEANKGSHDITKKEVESSSVVYSLQVLESVDVRSNIRIQTGAELEQCMHQLIPLSVAMKLSVSHYDGNKLQLLAPLEPNVNHQMTAFGGSLLSGCALVGWGLLQLQLGHMDRLGNVVVGEATSTFYSPVADCLRVESELPNHFDTFKQELLTKGVKSIQLDAHVFDGHAEQPAMTVSAKYVVRLQSYERT